MELPDKSDQKWDASRWNRFDRPAESKHDSGSTETRNAMSRKLDITILRERIFKRAENDDVKQQAHKLKFTFPQYMSSAQLGVRGCDLCRFIHVTELEIAQNVDSGDSWGM